MGIVSEVKNIETPKGGLVRWVVVQVTATWRPQRAVWIDVVIKMRPRLHRPYRQVVIKKVETIKIPKGGLDSLMVATKWSRPHCGDTTGRLAGQLADGTWSSRQV